MDKRNVSIEQEVVLEGKGMGTFQPQQMDEAEFIKLCEETTELIPRAGGSLKTNM